MLNVIATNVFWLKQIILIKGTKIKWALTKNYVFKSRSAKMQRPLIYYNTFKSVFTPQSIYGAQFSLHMKFT